MRSALALAMFMLAGGAQAACPVQVQNTPSQAARKLAISKLGQLLACKPDDPISDQSPCNTFASKALESIYGVKDFKTGANAYLSANGIHAAIKTSSQWKAIGAVLDDDNALCAQSAANAAMPVVAVMTSSPHGHIALVIPGEPQQSQSWGVLAPNSASFFYRKPEKAYIDGSLSKAFGQSDAAQATYYYRLSN